LKRTTALLLGMTLSVSAVAQTAAQLEMFKNLPRAQQEALAKQYGVDLNTLQASSSQGAQTIENPAVVVPLEASNEQGKAQTGNDSSNDLTAAAAAAEETLDAEAEERGNLISDLKIFGHSVFAGAPTTFAPATDIPVPMEYIVGPGDNIKLHMYGKLNSQVTLTVDREGTIMIPEVGPLQVSGVSFQQLREMIDQAVKERALGINVITTLGELRSVRVFILGEANRPGSYTVSALSTITNALFVSGGISETGSLRNIQLKRGGETVVSFDLYDLLLKGDTSNDVRLQAGDVLFIPPIGKTVGIGGEVKRQAIFELKSEKTLGQVLALSGGYLPTAHLNSAKINRISTQGERTVVDVNLADASVLEQRVSDGDMLSIYSILDEVEDVVTLAGHVYRPGNYAFRKGSRLGDVVTSIDELMPNVDLEYALIRRELPSTREIYFEQFALRDLIDGKINPALQARDRVYIFSNDKPRGKALQEDMQRLKEQATLGQPPKTIEVIGAAEMPATYPYMQGMTLADALVAAKGASLNADLDYALVKRVNADRSLSVLTLSLNDENKLATALQVEDSLYVFERNQDRAEVIESLIAELQAQTSKSVEDVVVSVNGQVKFPGNYPFSQDMTVADLVAAAGGLTESAYMGEADITEVVTDGKLTIEKRTKQVNLEAALRNDVKIEPKNVLTVRRIPDWYENQYVELGGEFVFPGRYLIREGETLAEVIQRAGGFTRFAYPQGAIYLRESVAQRQIEQIKLLEDKLNKDLTLIQTAKMMTASSPTMSQQNIERAISLVGENTEGLGRVAIDLPELMASSRNDFTLFDGDELYVPRKPTTVSVIGEVNQATTVAYRAGMTIDDYLEMSGGASGFADEGSAYIVRANGLIVKPSGHWAFGDSQIQPGDTIVVPLDVNMRDGLSLWTLVTQLVYNSAVAVAAIATL
jgi:polysaccharide export outer membrane protein